jgi:hypothetical protein
MDKEEIKAKGKELLALLEPFCKEKLDADYYRLCEKLINKMSRKRDVPFVNGKLNIWAAAIIHALGSINFLFDKSFEPYITVGEINDYFETKQTTVASKSKQIRDMFNMGYFDNEFSTQHSTESNPFNNLVMVDGLIVPLSTLPDELQETVKKVRSEGKDVEFTTE